MKNMIKARIAPLFGIIVLTIIGFLMIGCEDATTKVEYDYSKLPQVSAIAITKTTNKQYFIVTWDAVKGEEISYTMFLKQDGKESSENLYSWSEYGNSKYFNVHTQNHIKYDPDTGAELPNEDRNKFSYRITTAAVYQGIKAAGSYRFGIRTSKDDGKPSVIYSDIKWSDPVAITALPAITPTIAQTTNKAYFIVSWTGDKDAYDYHYFLDVYKDNIFLSDSDEFGYYYGLYPQNYELYAAADGAISTNADKTKWSIRIPSSFAEDPGTYFITLTNKFTTDIAIVPSLPAKSSTITIAAP